MLLLILSLRPPKPHIHTLDYSDKSLDFTYSHFHFAFSCFQTLNTYEQLAHNVNVYTIFISMCMYVFQFVDFEVISGSHTHVTFRVLKKIIIRVFVWINCYFWSRNLQQTTKEQLKEETTRKLNYVYEERAKSSSTSTQTDSQTLFASACVRFFREECVKSSHYQRFEHYVPNFNVFDFLLVFIFITFLHLFCDCFPSNTFRSPYKVSRFFLNKCRSW